MKRATGLRFLYLYPKYSGSGMVITQMVAGKLKLVT
jgi:hypothetical protein